MNEHTRTITLDAIPTGRRAAEQLERNRRAVAAADSDGLHLHRSSWERRGLLGTLRRRATRSGV
jgi:hypothetical protein